MYSKNKKDYDRAINAYQFHVQRFHTWTNYYSIFTGALFVGFYTMLKNETPSKVTQSSIYVDGILRTGINSVESTTSNDASVFLPLVIATVGLISAICWWMSTVGHYEWTKSWIRIVLQQEKFSRNGKIGIYGVLGEHINNTRYRPKYLSTMKITKIFIWVVIVGWLIALGYLFLTKFFVRFGDLLILWSAVCIIILLVVYYITYQAAGYLISSDLRSMQPYMKSQEPDSKQSNSSINTIKISIKGDVNGTLNVKNN